MSAITADGAPHVLLVEFELARLDLAAAIAAQRRKDTTAARGEVADCRARIDGILDSSNAWRPGPIVTRTPSFNTDRCPATSSDRSA